MIIKILQLKTQKKVLQYYERHKELLCMYVVCVFARAHAGVCVNIIKRRGKKRFRNKKNIWETFMGRMKTHCVTEALTFL